MKTLITLTGSLLLLSFFSFGQNAQRIDSLLQELDATSDQEMVFKLSIQLWSEYINHDVNAALVQAERIVQIGTALQTDTILGLGYEKKGIAYAYRNQFDSSGIYFRRALTLYHQENNYERIASIQRNLGQDHAMVGELDSAFYYYQKAGENFARINDAVGVADIYNSEAVIYFAKGFYNLAFEKAVAGEKIFEQYEELAVDLNQNRLVIGSIYAGMKDTLNAITYLQKTIDYFAANNLLRQYTSTGVLLADLQIPNYQSYPEITKLVDNIIVSSEKLEDPTLRNHGLLVKADLEYHKKNYAAAKAIQAGLVQQTTGEEGQEVLQAHNTLALGKTLLATRDYRAAIANLQIADKLAEQLKIETIEVETKKLLAQAYEKIGDYQNSLAYFRAYKVIDEKIYTEERVNRFNELQTIYEIEKKENALALQQEEIKTLNAEARNNRLISTLYAIGMTSFILISGLLFFGFRQRLKRNRTEREKQEAIFRQEIAYKKKELTSQTLHLVQKNTFIQELSEKLENIKQSPELFKTEFQKLTSLLRRQSSQDKNWELFKSYFSQVHNNFDLHLKSVAEDLTENDIRLASFLRMNLTTKEIASLINVLPDSVLKSKYRLKKKLGLSKEQDLGDYLYAIE